MEAAQQGAQPDAPASGSGNDDSDADTEKSGATEPHTSSEDEGEEVLTGNLEQPDPGKLEAVPSSPLSSRPAAAPSDAGDALTSVCHPCLGVEGSSQAGAADAMLCTVCDLHVLFTGDLVYASFNPLMWKAAAAKNAAYLQHCWQHALAAPASIKLCHGSVLTVSFSGGKHGSVGSDAGNLVCLGC